MQLCPRALEQGRAGWVWRCLLMPHLKAGNSEAPSVVRWSNNGNKVGAVRYVLVVELHRNLVITCRRGGEDVTQSQGDTSVIIIRVKSVCVCVSTGLLSDVRDATGSVFAVVEGDLGPAGSFHGDGQTTGAGLPRPDTELSWLKREGLTLNHQDVTSFITELCVTDHQLLNDLSL